MLCCVKISILSASSKIVFHIYKAQEAKATRTYTRSITILTNSSAQKKQLSFSWTDRSWISYVPINLTSSGAKITSPIDTDFDLPLTKFEARSTSSPIFYSNTRSCMYQSIRSAVSKFPSPSASSNFVPYKAQEDSKRMHSNELHIKHRHNKTNNSLANRR